MKLFVDDIRSAPDGWHRVRTITEAVRFLYRGEVDELSLDHDISHAAGFGPGSSCSCPENYGALAYVVAMMKEVDRPVKVWLHSANPGGRNNMRAVLKEAGVDVEDRPIAHPFGHYSGPDIREEI